MINAEGQKYLFSSVSQDEMRVALWNIDDAKSPDLHEFSAKNFKLHYDMLYSM